MIFSVRSSFPKNHGEQSHSDENTISHLSEISRSGIGIHIRTDFIHSRKWMKNCDLLLELFQKLSINHVTALDSFILCQVGKSLFLNSCHINQSTLRGCPFKIFCLFDPDALLFELGGNFLRHSEVPGETK